MKASEKRLKILSNDEIKALYGRPVFTDEERARYFSLSPEEKAALEEFHSLKSRICFRLQLGYFKARRLFFPCDLRAMKADVGYLRQNDFPDFQLNDRRITKVTRLKQQRLILKLFGYRSCGKEERRQLAEKARQLASVCSKPVYIFRELMRFLEEAHIVAPGYSFWQNTIGQALTLEQKRLADIVRQRLAPSDRQALSRLLKDSEDLYEITKLKRDPKDFTYSEIKREIGRGEQLRDLYHLAGKLLPELTISNESIRYYASLVTYYSVYRLKRFDEDTAFLYLLCFIYRRFQRLHDNLIESLLHHVRRFSDEAKQAARLRVYEQQTEANEHLQKAAEVLKLFTDDSIRDTAPFREARERAFGILEREKLVSVANRIAAKLGFDETGYEWEHIDRMANRFKCHLRPVLQAVEFAALSARDPLLEAIAFLKAAFRRGKPLSQYPPAAFPMGLMPESAKRYLCATDERGGKRPVPDRYEFLVYRLLKHGLEAGDLFCRDSVRFRSLEDDLIDTECWQRDKEQLIADTGLAILNTPIKAHLTSLKQRLEDKLIAVNRRIEAGENRHLQIKRHGRNVHWTLQGLPASEPANHPVFEMLNQTDLVDVLRFVDRECAFLGAFEHVLGRYARQKPQADSLLACLTAWSTNLRPGQMGEISDIAAHTLMSESDNFIRLETLNAADQLVCNAIAKLPLFRHYDIGETLHSGSDGQKFETRIDTVNARHSPKYFGLKKGVVAYTLVANHVPLNARIIGANEHESHYVFDILANNTTDIDPEVHSTDSHGVNEVNFVLLHLFGYQFAPRYKDIREKVTTSLYGFQYPSQYDQSWLIKPIRKINEALIIEEWDNVQRLVVSLERKTTTQSIIVGKLSSHARRNKTKRALWEYDHIIESLHLLDYVDSSALRKNVHRALNRVESYHQLRRAVSHANFGKLRFKTEDEQAIWNECARLISNCIIFYNATILFRLWEYRKSIGDNAGADDILRVSPVAWHHLNFRGRYTFRSQRKPIDIEALVQELAKIQLHSALNQAA